MTVDKDDWLGLREELASWSADASSDAHGIEAPKTEQLYAPAAHAAALDPRTAIVQGARGTGKSFWTGVLADSKLRKDAALAYPRLGLDSLDVQFGFTGLPAPMGLNRDQLDHCVPHGATDHQAKTFWWATVVRAVEESVSSSRPDIKDMLPLAGDLARRQKWLAEQDQALQKQGKTLVIVYDALDTVATTWSRRTLLTQSLFEVVWALRGYTSLRPKVFVRPDQLGDEGLRFVELPKLRAAAVRLDWSALDLYALLYVRLILGSAKRNFSVILKDAGIKSATRDQILTGDWQLLRHEKSQRVVMAALAGPHMSEGEHGYKKGKTYDWALKHLSDASGEVTPRSFLALLVGAARHSTAPKGRVLTPEGIRQGLRAASKMRVDQLHQEFPWIKAVLAPLAGLLLPAEEKQVFAAWRKTGTVRAIADDAKAENYLPPFRDDAADEKKLFLALQSISVMTIRADNRLDMPDLFRVAAKLLKKGATAPV